MGISECIVGKGNVGHSQNFLPRNLGRTLTRTKEKVPGDSLPIPLPRSSDPSKSRSCTSFRISKEGS